MIGAVWRGERPLWELFFLWWIVVGGAVSGLCIVTAFIVLLFIEASVLPWFSPFVGAVIALPYQVWAIVGVIRGALRAATPWRQLTLAFMILWLTIGPIGVLAAILLKK
jgi:hypothetical protein